MKSKTVASILRHVASKLPSLDAEGEPIEAPAQEAPKRNRRAAKQAVQQGEEPIAEEQVTGPGNNNEEERLEMLYETIGWPLGRTYGHAYDAFKVALTCANFFCC